MLDLAGISAALGYWIFSAGVWPVPRPPADAKDHRTFDCSAAKKTTTAGFSLIYSLFVPVSFGARFTLVEASDCVMRPGRAKTSQAHARRTDTSGLRHAHILTFYSCCFRGRAVNKWVNKRVQREFLMSCVCDESEKSHLKSEEKRASASVVELAAH